MPNWDSTKQLRVKMGNAVGERGNWSFTTTGLTVEVPTHFGRIRFANAFPLAEVTGYETLYAGTTVTDYAFTVTRKITPILLQSTGSDDEHVSTNDVSLLPIGVCPVAATLKKVSYYNLTKDGGTASAILIGDTRCYVTGKAYTHTGGNVEKEITGTAGDYDLLAVGDKVWLIGTNLTNGIYTVASVATDGSYITVTETVHSGDDTNVGVSTRLAYVSTEEDVDPPASGGIVVISAETDFADNAYPVVPAGALLMASTSGGGTSAPSGVHVQCELEPVPTSGLTFGYEVTR